MKNINSIGKYEYVAGVDEVGRGPLAGPVVACAVILDHEKNITGLTDSKLLTPKKREILSLQIQQNCIAWSLGRAEVEEIDELNIFQATLLAMRRALEKLLPRPTDIFIDGQHCPSLPFVVSSCKAIVGGDRLVPAISAASIVAKVARDKEMVELDKIYPQYGFAQHKGYGTKNHLLALEKYGATPIHRRSFAPVTAVMNKEY